MSDLVIVTADSSQNSTQGSKSATANCTTAGENHKAIAGGVEILGTTNDVVVTETRPSGVAGEVPSGWQVSAEGPTARGNWGVRAYAVCALVN